VTQYTYGLTRSIGHGHAFTQRLRVTNPAVAVGFTYSSDGRYWELLDSISFQIVTDSNAANRSLTLTFKDGEGVALATIPQTTAVAASKTAQYTYLWNIQSEQGSTNGPFLNVLPQIWFQPGFSVVVTGANLQAGDQISNIRVYTQRFVTGNEGYLLGVVDSTNDFEAVSTRLETIAS